MFRGNHPTRVDEKGRLKVPAEFKRVIDEKYAQRFYITSLDGKVAQIYDIEEVFESHELLRAGRRDGRAGAPADPADPA